MQLAVKAVVIDHISKKEAARRYGVPRATLQRYMIKMTNEDGGVAKSALGRHRVLPAELESELCDIIQEMESRLYEMTPEQWHSHGGPTGGGARAPQPQSGQAMGFAKIRGENFSGRGGAARRSCHSSHTV